MGGSGTVQTPGSLRTNGERSCDPKTRREKAIRASAILAPHVRRTARRSKPKAIPTRCRRAPVGPQNELRRGASPVWTLLSNEKSPLWADARHTAREPLTPGTPTRRDRRAEKAARPLTPAETRINGIPTRRAKPAEKVARPPTRRATPTNGTPKKLAALAAKAGSPREASANPTKSSRRPRSLARRRLEADCGRFRSLAADG